MKIIVVGAGFAGLMTIKTLRRRGYQGSIVLLAPLAEMFYYPASIWVPAGLYQRHDLNFPLDHFIQHYRVEYVAGSITGLDVVTKRLYTTAGAMDYERLVIATGGESARNLPGIAHVFLPCEGYRSLLAITERLALLQGGTLAFGFSGNENDPAAIRGEPLFEFLFGIDTLLRRQKRRDNFHLVFFTSCPELDARWGIREKGYLRRELARRGIQSCVGQRIDGFGEDQVILDGCELKSDLTIFIPELVGPAWAKQSSLPLSENGFIRADASCRVSGLEGSVYVAGDAGHYPLPAWVPKHGHTADLQAQVLVKNLIGDRQGEQTQYTFHQEFVYIVDTLDGGILVYRDSKRSIALRSRLFHWAKRLFIWSYLFDYRRANNGRGVIKK